MVETSHVLTLRFGTEDLLRTRFAAAPAPLMELGLACATLQGHDPLFDRWRRGLTGRLPRATGPMFELVPRTGAGPLFLDPVTVGLRDGLAAVRSAPRAFVHAELDRCVDAVTPWLRALHEDEAAAWSALEVAVRTAFDALLGRHWRRIEAAYRAELALRSRTWAAEGLRGALAGIYPGSRWRGAALEIPVPSALDIDLADRGLTLLPCLMWPGRPLVGGHPDGSVLLIYPAATPLPLAGGDLVDDSLSALLGTTRAGLLGLTAAPRTTTELAREAGVSAASASLHTKVLRAAGLITTVRDGKAVLHSLTPLGEALLAIDGVPG